MAITTNVPSNNFEDLQRDVQDATRFTNATAPFTNRVGQSITPIPVRDAQLAAKVAEAASAVEALGWFPVAGSFTDGGTITARNQVLFNDADSSFYSWSGALPKVVPAASTPASTGGISANAWVNRGDAALRSALAAHDSTVLVGGVEAGELGKGRFKNGSAALPSITFSSDFDTGLFLKAANSLALSTGGVERVTVTNTGRVGIGENTPASLLAVKVENNATAGIRCRAEWTGTTSQPYQNNDNCLFETYNKVTSDSLNLSWSVSADNSHNDIPAGVTDSGWRVGVLGWATSVTTPDYTHAGTLDRQYGVWGRAGFQGGGVNQSPAGAIINNAYGVHGEIRNDSTHAGIETAYAGYFQAFNYTAKTVRNSYAIFARASNGYEQNWAFYGSEGQFFNGDKAFFTSHYSEASHVNIATRGAGNAIEFGFPSAGGYTSAIGATRSSGFPFVSFCAEVSETGDTYKTAGEKGHAIFNDLNGSLIFAAITDANADFQTPDEAFRITDLGDARFAKNPVIPSDPPATAGSAGDPGMITWDSDYIYICVAPNTWKRVAIATW